MAKFELKPFHKDIPDSEIIDDLKMVASLLENESLTGDEYNKHGKFSLSTIENLQILCEKCNIGKSDLD